MFGLADVLAPMRRLALELGDAQRIGIDAFHFDLGMGTLREHGASDKAGKGSSDKGLLHAASGSGRCVHITYRVAAG
jgi:hypothetical protein